MQGGDCVDTSKETPGVSLPCEYGCFYCDVSSLAAAVNMIEPVCRMPVCIPLTIRMPFVFHCVNACSLCVKVHLFLSTSHFVLSLSSYASC